jgi:hypothetical protein
MYGDKRSLRSIRPTRARRPFDASVDPTEARCLMTVPFSGVVPSVSEDHVRYNGGLSSVHSVLQGPLDSEL